MRSEILKKLLKPFYPGQLRFLRTPCLSGRQANSELRTFKLTRRHFLRWLLGFPLFFPFLFRIPETEAAGLVLSKDERRSGSSIAAIFSGEGLVYEIGFWLFKRAAVGKLTFREAEKKGQYVAILQGETLGLLGFIARYRVDTYRATMEEVEGGRRLRALSFEEDVKIGSKIRKKTHLFDYQRRRWVTIRQRKDGIAERTEEEIPDGMVYDDFITASYNFRHGVYGEIEKGKKFVVPTFPRKGPSSYEVTVATQQEEEKKRRLENVKEGKDFFLSLFLDPEITHSKKGLIEGWLSKELYPVEGTIKDVAFFGDVKGTLVKKVRR